MDNTEHETDEGLTTEILRDGVQTLKEWMTKEPHLPSIQDDEWLLTILYSNKFSLEKTKYKLDNYYSLRNKYSRILKNRDPTSPDMKQASEALPMGVSDRLTKDGCRLIHFYWPPDSSNFHMDGISKRIFMIFDSLLLEKDRYAKYHLIADFRDVCYAHFLKVLMGMKVASEIFNNAYTERIVGLHALNPPGFIGKIVGMIKLFFPKKLADRIYVHAEIRHIFEMVDEDVLSSDFGGTGPPLEVYLDNTQQLLEKYRKWFEEQESVCSNELLRRKGHKVEGHMCSSSKENALSIFLKKILSMK